MAEDVKKKKPSNIMILTAVVVIATFIIGMLLIYIPFINENKSLRDKILYERDKNLLLGNIRALLKHLDVYQKRIPEKQGISSLLSAVSDMARREQVEIDSIKPDTPEERNLYTRFAVILDTVSSYEQLGRFLSRIESSNDFMRIESISIKRLDSGGMSKEDMEKFRPFDIKTHMVVSTIALEE